MKRIMVTDKSGRHYEPTYPRRAKGLVRKGRAEWIHASAICLTEPPKILEQGASMMFTDTNTITNTAADAASRSAEVTAAQIFAELQKIREDTSHIALAMEKLEKVPADGNADETVCTEKIAAIRKIAEAREQTNQALIHLYEKMVDAFPDAEE